MKKAIEYNGKLIRKITYYCYKNWTDAWDGFATRTRWCVFNNQSEMDVIDRTGNYNLTMRHGFKTLKSAKESI